ncbi:MAG: ATP-binding protein [Bacteroidota bacterium]
MRNNLIAQLFDKPIGEISTEDIIKYFEVEREETASIEFKSGEVTIEDLFKEIAAFLNTEGGLVIVGAPRERKVTKGKKKFNVCQGELTYSSFRSKDWLFQKISTNISPVPLGFKIVELISEKGTIYLIDVPQSKIPPHQANSDGRYYLRLESEAKPAPHGLVQALFDKRRKPELSANIELHEDSLNTQELYVSFKNVSNIPADKVGILIDIYNVNDVESDYPFTFQHDPLGDKFSMYRDTNRVLVSVISLPFNFKVTHKSRNFLVMAAFWSVESDFDFKFWTIDPINNTIVNQGDFKTSEITFTEALKEIEY